MKSTALIMVDLLQAFFHPEGSSYYAEADAILPNVIKVLAAARSSDSLVVHAVERHFPGLSDDEGKRIPPHCVEGTLDCEYASGAEPKNRVHEIEIPKRRYSSFMGTGLDLVLRSNQIQRVVIVGVKTNVCIRATAQDAFALGYEVVVPMDCSNSNRPHLADASFEDIRRYMGSTPDLHETLELFI
jgi:maleamate amidohydrolase